MMPRKLLPIWMKAFVATAMSMILAISPVLASFDEVGGGSRGAGMADVQVAIADDANAVFNNPAGLIQIGDKRLTTELVEHTRGLDDGSSLKTTYMSYAQGVKPGKLAIGAGFRSFKATDILKENTYLIGFGHRLNINPMGWEGVWSIGANAKLLERSFDGGPYASNAIANSGGASGRADPLLSNGGKSTALGLDAGLLYQFGNGLNNSLGLMAINFNNPNISIDSGDRAPSIIKLGAVRRTRWGLMSAEVRRARRLAGEPDTDLALGVERHFRISKRDAMSLRSGYAEGSRGYKAFTLGAAYHLGKMDFDYSISLPIGNLSSTDGHQRVGFSTRFGSNLVARPKPTPQVKPILDTEPIRPPMVEQPAQPMVTTPTRVDPVPAPEPVVTPQVAPVPVVQPVPTAVPVAQPKPAAKPKVVAPVKTIQKSKPVVKPKSKPLPSKPVKAQMSPEAKRAWAFYEEAVRREVSDHEKIEILESMLMKFGESEANRINGELDKLRKRVSKEGLSGQ